MITIRKQVKLSSKEIPIEQAHGGSGSRQLIFSRKDEFVSNHLEAVTRGFLPPKATFDWHHHDGIDELFFVNKGEGQIEFEDGECHDFMAGDFFYTPANIAHKITNTGNEDIDFYFIRIDA